MAGLVAGPPKDKSPPPPPEPDSDGPVAREELRRRKTKNASGRQSTVLTSNVDAAPMGADYGGGTVG